VGVGADVDAGRRELQVDDRPAGLRRADNSLTSVSLEPPLVSFCPSRSSLTWSRMRRAGRFGVNVLGRQHQRFVARATSAGADRFAGLNWEPGRGGVPLLTDALAASTVRSSPSIPPATTGSSSGASTTYVPRPSKIRSSSTPAHSAPWGSEPRARRGPSEECCFPAKRSVSATPTPTVGSDEEEAYDGARSGARLRQRMQKPTPARAALSLVVQGGRLGLDREDARFGGAEAEALHRRAGNLRSTVRVRTGFRPGR
jgi:3-hydroxy-9,10-secoandrosta-1,3,5(10)-triene-9,17-dione monooxygenase reductase component